MSPEQSGREEVKDMGGRRVGEEVTATSAIPPNSTFIPLSPSEKNPSHQHRREKRRPLDHRPPREKVMKIETERLKRRWRQNLKN